MEEEEDRPEGESEQERTIRILEVEVIALRSRPTFHVGQLGTFVLTWPGTVPKEFVESLALVKDLVAAGWYLTANSPLNNRTVVAGPSWQLVPPGL